MDSDPYIKDGAHVVRVVLRVKFFTIFVNLKKKSHFYQKNKVRGMTLVG